MNDDHSTQGAFVRDVKYASMSVIVLIALIFAKAHLPVVSSAMQAAQVANSLGYYNIVGHWGLEGNADSDALIGPLSAPDIIGAPLTLFNTTYSGGRFGDGVSFNGVDSYMGEPDWIGFSGTPGSFALWLNPVTPDQNAVIVEMSTDYASSKSGFGAFYVASSTSDLVCPSGTMEVSLKGNVGYNTKCYAFPGAGWHHYVFELDKGQDAANEITVFVDGIPAVPSSQPAAADNTIVPMCCVNGFYLMSRGGDSMFMGGLVDDLYMFNGALTTADVQTIFKGQRWVYSAPTTIYAVRVSDITETGATVHWDTDKKEYDDELRYGTTLAYGQMADLAEQGYGYKTAHFAVLRGLAPGTTYHFQITENLDDVSSPDYTFTTASVTGGTGQGGPSGSVVISTGQIPSSGPGTVTTPSSQIIWPSVIDRGQQSTTTVPSYFNDPLANMVKAIDPNNDGSLIRSTRPQRNATVLTPYNVDTAPPTTPQNLRASFVDAHHIDLDWDASTDNIGVAGYRIYRDGELHVTTTDTHYSDVLDIPQSSYVYTVAAFDATENVSPQSVAEIAVLPDNSLTFYQRFQIALARVRQFWDRFIYLTGYRINILLNGGQ